jgi:hypothetical protein
MTGIAGEREVCMKRISNVVPVSIMADFHAANEISSDLIAVLLSCAVDMSPVKDV